MSRQHKGNPYAKPPVNLIIIDNVFSDLEQRKKLGISESWPEFTRWWFSTTAVMGGGEPSGKNRSPIDLLLIAQWMRSFAPQECVPEQEKYR